MTGEEDAPVTLTIKGEGRDAPWLVFRGRPETIHRHVVDFFGFPEDEVAGLDTVELAINADSTFKALTTTARELGGIAVPDPEKPKPVEEPTANAWAEVKQAMQEPRTEVVVGEVVDSPKGAPAPVTESPVDVLLGELEEATSVDKLHALYYKHKALFTNAAVADAYKEKGRALTGK